jgi:hypothetical protein
LAAVVAFFVLVAFAFDLALAFVFSGM